MYLCQISLILVLQVYGIVQCIDMKLSYNVYKVHVLYMSINYYYAYHVYYTMYMYMYIV